MKQILTSKSSTAWILLVLMCVAVLASVLFFQKQSLRLDEAQSLWQTSHTPMKIIELIGKDVHVPLYHLMLHAWQFMFGNEVVVARLFSLLFFLISIPLMYIVGHRIYGDRVAMFATLLFTISPFMNWYGNEIRMYSLFVFLTLLNTYFFIGIYKKGDGASWAGFAITALFGIYCHYFFFLVLLTDFVFYLLNRKLFSSDTFKRFVVSGIILGVAFVPWLINVYMLGSASQTQPNLQTPTSINFFNTLSQFVFGFQTDHLNTIFLSLWPLTVLLGFLALRKNRAITPETLYMVLLFIIPNAVAFAVSIFLRPVYVTRYLIFTLPAMYFLLSWLLYRYAPFISRIFRYSLVGLLTILLVGEAVSASTPVKENYREVAEFLRTEAKSSDAIVLSAPFTIYPMYYYYSGPISLKTLPLWSPNEAATIPPYEEGIIEENLKEITADRANMWVLLSYDQGYEEDLRIYLDTHYERVFHQEFSPKMNLYKYKLKYE